MTHELMKHICIKRALEVPPWLIMLRARLVYACNGSFFYVFFSFKIWQKGQLRNWCLRKSVNLIFLELKYVIAWNKCGHRLAYKSSSKSAKRDRAPCLEARSAIVRARASERVARASESSCQVHSTRSERATLRKSNVDKVTIQAIIL